MKATMRIIALSILTIASVGAAALVTTQGYMTWWFWSEASVAIDGNPHGYIHRNRSHSALIITRTDSHPTQSYFVMLSGRKRLFHCGEWHAPRFPIFAIGDLNPPCTGFNTGSDMRTADDPIPSTLKVGPQSLEFQTTNGKKVTASW